MRIEDRALLDGRQLRLSDARLPITDDGVARGDGVFETIGVWSGRPFRLDDHLLRLAASLEALTLPSTDLDRLRADAREILQGITGDGVLRIYVTGSGTRLLTLVAPPDRPLPRRLVSRPAPWIRPRDEYRPAGAKTMSYAPNMAATRSAQRADADDALLVSVEGHVLEGPTFCVLWLRDRRLYSPAVQLGIVDSISRRSLLEIGDEEELPTETGAFPLSDVLAADEVLVCSATRQVERVESVDGRALPGGAVGERLAQALEDRRRAGAVQEAAAPGELPTAGAPGRDPNVVAVRNAAIDPSMSGWLHDVAGQVDTRLDRAAPGWRGAEQADPARACVFGLLMGRLATLYPHTRPALSAVAEAHPSFSTLLAGSRLATLEQIAADPVRIRAWLGPLIDVGDTQRLQGLLD